MRALRHVPTVVLISFFIASILLTLPVTTQVVGAAQAAGAIAPGEDSQRQPCPPPSADGTQTDWSYINDPENAGNTTGMSSPGTCANSVPVTGVHSIGPRVNCSIGNAPFRIPRDSSSPYARIPGHIWTEGYAEGDVFSVFVQEIMSRINASGILKWSPTNDKSLNPFSFAWKSLDDSESIPPDLAGVFLMLGDDPGTRGQFTDLTADPRNAALMSRGATDMPTYDENGRAVGRPGTISRGTGRAGTPGAVDLTPAKR